jgi:hypothetical protein
MKPNVQAFFGRTSMPGGLPEAHAHGVRYFRVPANLFPPADARGKPLSKV